MFRKSLVRIRWFWYFVYRSIFVFLNLNAMWVFSKVLSWWWIIFLKNLTKNLNLVRSVGQFVSFCINLFDELLNDLIFYDDDFFFSFLFVRLIDVLFLYNLNFNSSSPNGEFLAKIAFSALWVCPIWIFYRSTLWIPLFESIAYRFSLVCARFSVLATNLDFFDLKKLYNNKIFLDSTSIRLFSPFTAHFKKILYLPKI